MKVKFCAGWETSELITKRLIEQFKTNESDVENIEFVYDNTYDMIVFNNYVTEEPKENSKSIIFFHEPTWSGNHQKTFSSYKDIIIFGHNKENYDSPEKVVELPSHLFYGGRGPSTEGWDFWNYNNLKNYDFKKTKVISSVVSPLGNDERIYPEGCIYKERVNLIKEIIDKCEFVDAFGWGDKFLGLKKDGVVDYKFSICIENSNEKNYISEKFYDCILTNTIPIYFGCSNIKTFWPEDGYFLIDDINNTSKIVDLIKYIFENSEEIYDRMLPELIKMKERYFTEFNPLKKINEFSKKKMNKVTLVTGLWDLGRGNLTGGWARPFEHYLEKFKQLLQVEENMIIFGDAEIQKFVNEHRSEENTQFILRDLEWFKNNEYYEKIQKIRTNPEWYNQVGWLSDSTQAKLEMYNPLVMSKMFLLHDSKILDKFDSEYMFWIDAGLSNTVHPGYFTHDKVLNNLENYINNFHFICFPYETNSEIHGFEYESMKKYSNSESVDKVARAGFFGGKKNSITQLNNIYYSLLIDTLSNGLMGTEESLFTIMLYQHPELISYSLIDGNGLIGKFFEDLKNNDIKILTEDKKIDGEGDKVSLYVIGFNSPNQLDTLITSMKIYDSDFLTKTEKYLLNNSTDRTTDERYREICEQNGFTIIWPNENLGICGGRQFIAEHFDSTDSDYCMFFEDDMFFYAGDDEVCRNGFVRKIKNLFNKVVQIISKEKFDFLKFNYSEFFGDNGTQWSWYNVPQAVRSEYWPNYSQLPKIGTDPNAPKTEYKNIVTHEGLSYVTGDVYYCNWPQIVSKKGNKKMFLETKWAHPFEQTWMSHMFQETKKGNLRPALLLATPTEHNRFEHYSANLRKES